AAAARAPAAPVRQRDRHAAHRGCHPRSAREHGPLRGRADDRGARRQAGRARAQSGGAAALRGPLQGDGRHHTGRCRWRRRMAPRVAGMTPSTETRTSGIPAALSLVILGVSYGAPWIVVVALKPIAAEMGGARSVPSFASSLAWFGSALGGIGMGWLADRYGVRWTVMFGSVMIAIGLAISS